MKNILSLFILLLTLSTSAQKSFEFQGKKIKPGSKEHFKISISYPENKSTFIPVTIIHGQKEGPVLGITAGVHGFEYVPIMAAQKFGEMVNPEQLAGTIILVQIANLPSFLERSVEVNPIDRKNLNRSFPGNMQGSITDKIAATLSSQIIAHSDYFIDMHAGDANNDLMAYSGYYNYDDQKEVSATSKELAKALGFQVIVQFGNTKNINEKSLYCSREAYIRGIPSVDIECGRKGLVEAKEVEKINNGLTNVLKHLKMLNSKPEYPEEIILVDQRESMSSNHDGFFYSDIKSGQYIKKGMKLGFITDFFGNIIEEIYAPCNGFILYKSFNPPIKKGAGLFSIAVTP